MRIIPDNKKAITHYGVLGQRWGVRQAEVLANMRARREKGANVAKQLKEEGVGLITNRSDFTNATWASQSIAQKAGRAIGMAVVGNLVKSFVFTGELPNVKDPAWGLEIAKKALISYGTKEITATTAMKRYKESGERDLSKRQYKTVTPEHAIKAGINIGLTVAPVIGPLSKRTMGAIIQNRAETEARMKKWGPNILDKKTSDMETVFDDGYMSVLQKIKD